MEKLKEQTEKISKSIGWKAITIASISLFLLIPGMMIQDLISERSSRNDNTIDKINNSWSNAQTINGPILTIPYETTVTLKDNTKGIVRKTLHITPNQLSIVGNIHPQVRQLGIFKSILYDSELKLSGTFPPIDFSKVNHSEIIWEEAMIRIGISDLRGVSEIPLFKIGNHELMAASGGTNSDEIGQGLMIATDFLTVENATDSMNFICKLNVKGSSSLNFVPIGKNTNVNITGNWNAPGFTGNFLPEHNITESNFKATWQVLHFNRNIPDQWSDNQVDSFDKTVFGVKLVDMVNHYQQNMRSAKYAIMFVVLTFITFFFAEIFTGIRVHPLQYLLIGLALILFYSLLLSLSEQIGFGLSYLIASIATISMIALYSRSIFKSSKQTGLVASMLAILYGYLYVVIQIEDVALLIGSIGLFIILGIIMLLSGKIKWYKDVAEN